MKKDDIIQNLKDAGCGIDMIDEFFRLKQKGMQKELQMLLYRYKKELLTNLYDNQKKIDCLDFLIFSQSQEEF